MDRPVCFFTEVNEFRDWLPVAAGGASGTLAKRHPLNGLTLKNDQSFKMETENSMPKERGGGGRFTTP